MKVVVIGRGGNVGGALADLWERRGHEVTRIGREGGNVSDGIAVHRIANGKIVEHWSELDNLGVMQQLGVVPTPEVPPPEQSGTHPA